MKKAISDFADRQGILIEDNFTFGEWEALRIRRGRDLRGFMKAADLVGAKIEAIAAPDDYLHRFGKPLTWEAEERGRGQKVGPIDRGVRRSIYVFA